MKVMTVALMLLSAGAACAGEKPSTASRADEAAKCVRAAIKESLKLLGPTQPGDATSDERRAQIKKQLDAMNAKASEGVGKCLSEREVYALGWFSFLQDTTSIVECGVHPTAALDSHREEDDADSDLINGSTKWQIANYGEQPIDAHPFFQGQAAARSEFSEGIRKRNHRAVCDDLISGFGDQGDRFPGLVSSR